MNVRESNEIHGNIHIISNRFNAFAILIHFNQSFSSSRAAIKIDLQMENYSGEFPIRLWRSDVPRVKFALIANRFNAIETY